MYNIHAYINVLCLKLIAGIIVIVILAPTWYSICIGAAIIYAVLTATNAIRQAEIDREDAEQQEKLWRTRQKFKRRRHTQ